jgi:hypothetical protein
MDIAVYTIRAISEAIVTPPYVFMLILLALTFFMQNKKTVLMQKMVIGEKTNSAFELTISQVVLGIFAGTAASLMLSYLGVVFNNDIILLLLFTISIMLLFLGERFVCFSYSADIILFHFFILMSERQTERTQRLEISLKANLKSHRCMVKFCIRIFFAFI